MPAKQQPDPPPLEYKNLPREFVDHSEILGVTFQFRRRTMRDNLTIARRQAELVGDIPLNPETYASHRTALIIAELETALVSPESYDFENCEDEPEIHRIAVKYETWLMSFWDAAKPGIDAARKQTA